MSKSKKKVPAGTRPVSEPAAGKGTLEAFRALHDKAHIARTRVVAALRALGNAYEYEGDFIARCGLDRTLFGRVKAEFDEAHSFVPPRIRGTSNPRRIWCGTAAFRKKLLASLEPK